MKIIEKMVKYIKFIYQLNTLYNWKVTCVKIKSAPIQKIVHKTFYNVKQIHFALYKEFIAI